MQGEDKVEEGDQEEEVGQKLKGEVVGQGEAGACPLETNLNQLAEEVGAEALVVLVQHPDGPQGQSVERRWSSLAEKHRCLPAQRVKSSRQRQGKLQREKGEHLAGMLRQQKRSENM